MENGKLLAVIECKTELERDTVFTHLNNPNELIVPKRQQAQFSGEVSGLKGDALVSAYASLVRSNPKNFHNHWIIETYKADSETKKFIQFSEVKDYFLSKLRDFIKATGVKALKETNTFQSGSFPDVPLFPNQFSSVSFVGDNQIFELRLTGHMYDELIAFLKKSELFHLDRNGKHTGWLDVEKFLNHDSVIGLPSAPDARSINLKDSYIEIEPRTRGLNPDLIALIQSYRDSLKEQGFKVAYRPY